MAIRAKDIYDGKKKSRFHTGLIITIILALVVAAILVFYGLRSYCVYDKDGNATIVLPWSQNAATEKPSESSTESAAPSPSESPLETETAGSSENSTGSPDESSVAGQAGDSPLETETPNSSEDLTGSVAESAVVG